MIYLLVCKCQVTLLNESSKCSFGNGCRGVYGSFWKVSCLENVATFLLRNRGLNCLHKDSNAFAGIIKCNEASMDGLPSHSHLTMIM